jgi:uncharacterized RDD family membrane protein YckC
MELEDHITVAVPEGGELSLQLAGLGSRFIAGATDLIIQLLVVVVLVLVTGAVSGGGQLDLVVLVIGLFLVWFVYPIAFEVLARGRTPGKRLSHLRVVRENGDAVDLSASTIRNLVRVVAGLTFFYVPTTISILATKKNQRPGDLAAGTLVIRDTPASNTKNQLAVAPASDSATDITRDWDLSGVTADEIATVRAFLARRQTLDRQARTALATRLANGLAAKIPGASREGSAEEFLQTLVDAKSERA